MPSLMTLATPLRAWALWFFRRWHQANPGLTVTSARRSWAAQQQLYQAFLSGGNNGLPAEPPGKSLHNYGLAFDMARPGIAPQEDPVLPLAGAEWRRLGGVWRPGDPVHFAWGPSMGASRRKRRGASRK